MSLKRVIILLLLAVGALTACATTEPVTEAEHSDAEHSDDEHADHEHDDDEHDDHEHDDEHADHEHDDHEHEHTEGGKLSLPDLEEADLGGNPLRVVATTSIIGDVVAQVGGDTIELTTLMGPGQDPHSYEPAAADLVAAAEANVIFVNGWNLEEGLADDLETIGEGVPVVPISANIEPLEFGGHDHGDEHEHEEGEEHEHEEGEEHEHEEGEEHDHDHGSADPHVWFSVHSVEQWVDNVVEVLSALDPANADVYAANADAYRAELAELETYAEEQLGSIPEERRFLVTNHDAFGYLAAEYNFEVLGTIIPSLSTLAEPSAEDLVELIEEMEEHGVCTIFTETTVSDTLAQTVAGELDNCDNVEIAELYTGALGPDGSGAETYIGMVRANVDSIVANLQ